MQNEPVVHCELIDKDVTIKERKVPIPNSNGDDVLAVSKYCSNSRCNQYGLCDHTKGERYYIRGGKLIRFL